MRLIPLNKTFSDEKRLAEVKGDKKNSPLTVNGGGCARNLRVTLCDYSFGGYAYAGFWQVDGENRHTSQYRITLRIYSYEVLSEKKNLLLYDIGGTALRGEHLGLVPS